MIEQGFIGKLNELHGLYREYVGGLKSTPKDKREIDFSKEPDAESIRKLFAIPRFTLFSDFFVNRDVDQGTNPISINYFHHEASIIIPDTYNTLWQFARRSHNWIYLISCGSSTITDSNFFINFHDASENLDRNKRNELLDKTLSELFESFMEVEYAPKTLVFPTESSDLETLSEKSYTLSLEQEPVFSLRDESELNGVIWYNFVRYQGMVELTTPWKLDSEIPPLLKIINQRIN